MIQLATEVETVTRQQKIRKLQKLVNRYGWNHPAVKALVAEIEGRNA
jgi:hypothetical protein